MAQDDRVAGIAPAAASLTAPGTRPAPSEPTPSSTGQSRRPEPEARSGRAVTLAGGAVAGIGALALFGWWQGIAVLERPLAGQVAIRPNAAVCLILLAGSLAGARPGVQPARRRTGAAAAAGALLLAGLSLVEDATGSDLRIDQVLFGAAVRAEGSVHAGRIVPNTALALALAAAAHLWLTVPARPGRRAVAASQLCAAGTVLIGVLALYGAAYQVPPVGPVWYLTGLSVHTAAALTLIGGATLLIRTPHGLAQVLTGRGVSPTLARRILGAALVVPFGLGWLRIIGQQAGLYETRLGIALLVTGNVAVFAALGLIASRTAARLEASRDRAEASVRSQAPLRTLVDNTPAAVYLKDADGRFLLVNDEFQRAFGVAGADPVGLTVDDVFPPAMAREHRANDRQALAGGTVTRVREVARHPDGNHTYLSVRRPLLDPAGHAYALCCISTDITPRPDPDPGGPDPGTGPDRGTGPQRCTPRAVAIDLIVAYATDQLPSVLTLARAIDATGAGPVVAELGLIARVLTMQACGAGYPWSVNSIQERARHLVAGALDVEDELVVSAALRGYLPGDVPDLPRSDRAGPLAVHLLAAYGAALGEATFEPGWFLPTLQLLISAFDHPTGGANRPGPGPPPDST